MLVSRSHFANHGVCPVRLSEELHAQEQGTDVLFICKYEWQDCVHVIVFVLPGDLNMDQGLMAEYQVTRKDILSFAWQVARGMDYLSKKKVRCTL